MSHIAFELDALPLVPKVARAAALPEGTIAWGLLQMWEWCWRERTDEVSGIHLKGFFGADLGETLAAFGFLEQSGRAWRVCGAARYLRIQAGRSKGGRAASGNLKQNRLATGSSPADVRLPSGSPPADPPAYIPADDRAFSDERLAKKTIAPTPEAPSPPKPPKKPSAQQEFFRWAQAEACAAAPSRLAEREPDGPVINAQLKVPLAGIGRLGLEAAWRRFMLDPYALSKGLPWALFVSKLPELHNRSQSLAVAPKTRTLQPGEDPYAEAAS